LALIINTESTPTTPGAASVEVFANSSKRPGSVDDTGTVVVFAGVDTSDNLTNKTINLAAGTTAIDPLTFASGSLLTTPLAGSSEFDGVAFYDTIDTTSGRGLVPVSQLFRLSADGSAIGPGIADYFGATSAFPTELNGVYLFKFYCWFLKTTAGTVTWTLTHTQTLTNINAWYTACAVGGIGTNAAMNGAGIDKQTAAANALPVTAANLTTATEQYHEIIAIAECATAGNIRLRVTSGAGTVTPRRGSFYTATRLPAASTGTFVA